MEENQDKKPGGFIMKFLAAEVLWYCGYNFYVTMYHPISINGGNLVFWNIVIVGMLVAVMSALGD